MPAIKVQTDDLKMMHGYLAPQSISSNADSVTVVERALPGVACATRKVSVQPTTDVTSPAAQKTVNRLKGARHQAATARSPVQRGRVAKPANSDRRSCAQTGHGASCSLKDKSFLDAEEEP
jgi:hypothetical protein